MYTPIEWQDEVVQYPYRYKETQNADGTIEHTPSPGETLQEGTPQSATNFNQMDKGTFEAMEIANEAVRILRSTRNTVDGLTGEKIQVTLTNTQEYPFNNSQKTVRLTRSRNTTDYIIYPEVISCVGGAVGEIDFTGKLLNGFKAAYTGSATQVVLNLYVRGGI